MIALDSHSHRTVILAAVACAAVALLLSTRRRRVQSPSRRVAHQATRPLGKQSGVRVTILGQGGAPLGDLYKHLSDASALGALAEAHASGIGYFDTSPWYGVGLSEMRCGLALHRLPRSSFVFQTKVGRYLVPDPQAVNGTGVGWIGGLHMRIAYDYSAAAIQRQLADSLQRHGLGRIDSLVIHDLEPTPHRTAGDDGVAAARGHLATLRASGFGALQRLRAAGVIRAFGAGLNIDEDGEDPVVKRGWNREYAQQLLSMHEGGAADKDAAVAGGADSHGIDFLLLANMYSLLSDEANTTGILDACAARGVGVVIGGPFSSGILATGADPEDGSIPKFNCALSRRHDARVPRLPPPASNPRVRLGAVCRPVRRHAGERCGARARAPARGRLPRVRRAADCRGAAVPAAPPRGVQRHPRRSERGGGGIECRADERLHPRAALGGDGARRATTPTARLEIS